MRQPKAVIIYQPTIREDIFYSKDEILAILAEYINYPNHPIEIKLFDDNVIRFYLPRMILNFKCESGVSCLEEFDKLFESLDLVGVKYLIMDLRGIKCM